MGGSKACIDELAVSADVDNNNQLFDIWPLSSLTARSDQLHHANDLFILRRIGMQQGAIDGSFADTNHNFLNYAEFELSKGSDLSPKMSLKYL